MKNLFKVMTIFSFVNIWFGTNAQEQYKSVQHAEGLSIGQSAPLFSAKDQDENLFHLKEALSKGPVVLIFYRGQWCPICNKHLAEVEQELDQIYEKGALVIAVSPETTEFLNKTKEKTKASYRLLHDEDYRIAETYDVAFLPDLDSRTTYNTVLGANLKDAHSDESQRLPIPATYVIDQNGIIRWRHFDPNYKKRSSVQDIINALDQF